MSRFVFKFAHMVCENCEYYLYRKREYYEIDSILWKIKERLCNMYSFKYNQQDTTLYNIFITVNALHVSSGFSAHHRELINCTHSIGYMPSLLAATASEETA